MRARSSDKGRVRGRRWWLLGTAGFTAGVLARSSRARGMGPARAASDGGQESTPARAGSETPAAPVTTRVLMVGDSMIAGAFGLFLERRLEKEYGLSVDRTGKSSTGLSRPDFFDWTREVTKIRSTEKPYDAVICMFGGNDGQGQFMGRNAEPKWIRYGEDGWDDEYRRRIVAFADAATGGTSALYWVGMPVMGLSRLHERMRHLNRIYRGELCVRPRAHFIDIWRTLADSRGRYVKRMKIGRKRVSVRVSDGVHLTGAGATYLVEQVAPRIANHLLGRATETYPGAPLIDAPSPRTDGEDNSAQ